MPHKKNMPKVFTIRVLIQNNLITTIEWLLKLGNIKETCNV